MKAMVLKAFGGPEHFSWEEVPMPSPGPGEVRIRIHATSVNPVDLKMREGRIPGPVPVVLGRDIAGVIDAVGEGAGQWRPGASVLAVLSGPRSNGAYAEYVTTPVQFVTAKPERLSTVQGAAMGVAGLTAHEAVIRKGRVQAGEAALVTGAAGGVGSMVVQLLKNLGATPVLATAGSDESVAYLTTALGLSADHIIRYRDRDLDDLEAEVRTRTDGAGVDAAFDLVGGEMKKLCLRCLGFDGRTMSIVEEESDAFEFDIWRPGVSPLWQKSGAFHYVAMSARARSANPADWSVYPSAWQALTELVEAGRLSPPPVTEMGELNEANLAQAHRLIATGHTHGKLVLRVV